MRIGIAQINSTLGDFHRNLEKILEYSQRAKDRKCELVVFPECALFGYHPFDLLERSEIVEAQEKLLETLIKKIPKDLGVIVGLMKKNPARRGRPYFNSAALIQRGKKPRFFNKQLLPTGDVFDEARFIEAGDLRENYFMWKGKRFFLTICEDIWAWPDQEGKSPYKKNPIESVPKKKTEMVINLSASPYFLGKKELRAHVAQKTAAYFRAPILYANLVGAQDEIIFDGSSFVIDPRGKKLLQCHSFEEDLNVFDTETREAWAQAEKLSKEEELHRALVMGIRDFVQKTGFERVHLGLSGGIDSAVVACLAVDALGPQRVHGIALPGPYSSEKSLTSAKTLAKNLGIQLDVISITETYNQAIENLQPALGLKNLSVTHENLQSRTRGLFLMAYANQKSSLLLTTGNKSEYATGYATLYGDMCGGLAPLGDLLKRQVYEIAAHYNSEQELIPRFIVERPPTAELRPGQKDQDSLPDYDVLDRAVENVVEDSKPLKNKTEKWLLNKVLLTEFKRWQAPPILKISSHSFGRGRRYPVAHRSFSSK